VFADSFEAIAPERARRIPMPGNSGLVCGTRVGRWPHEPRGGSRRYRQPPHRGYAAHQFAANRSPPMATRPPTRTRPRRTSVAPLSLAEVMAALAAAGSEQTRRTYARHGVAMPMFGVSFATLKTLARRIRVDHELALALWDSGNFDARNLAVKVVDPARMTPPELDRWAQAPTARMCGSYVAHVAAEGPHAHACVGRWLASADENLRTTGWKLVAALAMLDESPADDGFLAHLATIERGLQGAPNAEREAMNHAVIAIGCRNPSLRAAATAAAARIGKVEVDHGDTACKTADARTSIDKAWAHAAARQAASPAAQERGRESMRTRC
jgi:3-methyladenine DNA glycosylase AlkD